MTSYVSVIGPGDGATPEEMSDARSVGRLLAERGAIVVCGGLGGVMAAAAAGAAEAGGLSVGLLPGTDRLGACDELTIALPTGLGELRNGLVVRCADAVIAVGGSWGTLSELALAIRGQKPTVSLHGWTVLDRIGSRVPVPEATTPAEAVDLVFARLKERRS